jgi:hypothetical protein
VLVRDQRALFAEVQQNDADDQACDRAPHFKRHPGREHDNAAKSNDGMRTSPVCDLPGNRRNEYADRSDDPEQAGDFGAETVSGGELQRQKTAANNKPTATAKSKPGQNIARQP